MRSLKKGIKNTTKSTEMIAVTEKSASNDVCAPTSETIPNTLLIECSNILMQDQLEPDNLAIQSMKQLNYVLQSLTNSRKSRIVNGEETLREELPFSMASDCKKLAEAIGIMMKGLNESRKIRTSTYLKLKELKNKDE